MLVTTLLPTISGTFLNVQFAQHSESTLYNLIILGGCIKDYTGSTNFINI